MDKNMTLLTFQEFCDYLRIKPTLAKKLISDPKCNYLVKIGDRNLICKELLDQAIHQAANKKINLLSDINNHKRQ